MLNQRIDCEITKTAYAFVTAETPVYIIGFQYIANGTASAYGYAIAIDDNKICQLKAEGRPVADFVFQN